jgi:xylulokinase
MTPAILAVDSGSSAVKAAVVGLDGAVLGTGVAAIETLLAPGGVAEQCPRRLWAAVLEACRGALARAEARRVAGVACSSQYSSVIPLGADGEAAGNLVLWRDTRGARYVRALLDAHPGAAGRWAAVHGLPPGRGGRDTLAHMLHIRHDAPEVYGNTGVFLEPADFLAFKFSGVVAATPGSVYKMLLTDNRDPDRQCYDETLVALSGLDPGKLPPLREPGCLLGRVLPEVADELGIPPDAQVVSGMNDNHAVALGTAALTPATAGLSIGTTANVSARVDGLRTDEKHRLATMPTPLAGRSMVMAENGMGGKVLEITLERIFCPEDEWSIERRFAALEAAAGRAAPGSGGVLFLPWLNGAGSPASDPEARAGFLNLSVATTRDDMMRSLLEGVVLNLRWLNDVVEDFAETRFERLMFTGGGALSDGCAQIMADVFARPIHQMDNPRFAPCRGLAFFAFCRLGLLREDDQGAFLRVKRVFAPHAAHRALYEARLAQLRDAYHRVTPLVAAHNNSTAGDDDVR